VGELQTDYPSAAACLAEDLPALCVHLRYPLRLRKRLRSINLLESDLYNEFSLCRFPDSLGAGRF
jgi:hypothetical protein